LCDRLLNFADRVISVIAVAVGWVALLLLCGLRVYEVIARQYVDQVPSGLLRAIESQAFVLMVVMALGYTYLRNSHVRVDIFRARFSRRTQAWLELAGGVLVILPLSFGVIGLYTPFVWDTYQSGARTLYFLGAPLRWLVELTIPFGLALLGLAGLIVIARNVRFLTGRAPHPAPHEPV